MLLSRSCFWPCSTLSVRLPRHLASWVAVSLVHSELMCSLSNLCQYLWQIIHRQSFIDALNCQVIMTSQYRYSFPLPSVDHDAGIFHYYPDSLDLDGPVIICSVVGKLNYLAQTTRPDLMQAVHSIAKFSANSKKEHGDDSCHVPQQDSRHRSTIQASSF